MFYYCEVCYKNITRKNKNIHFKSKTHIKFSKYKHKILSPKDVDIKKVDETFYSYIANLNKKIEY